MTQPIDTAIQSGRHVVYACDWEPIAVIELHSAAARELLQHKRVTLLVMDVFVDMPATTALSRTAGYFRLELGELSAGQKRQMYLQAGDKESSHLLRSFFVPGYIRAMNEHHREACASRLIADLNKYGD